MFRAQADWETKRRKVELGSHSWMDCLAAELFFNSCFSDAVFVTLFRTAVKTHLLNTHLSNIVVLAVAADGLLSLYGSECKDELLIGTWPHPTPPAFPSPE